MTLPGWNLRKVDCKKVVEMPHPATIQMGIRNSGKQQKTSRSNGMVNCDINAIGFINGAPHVADVKTTGAKLGNVKDGNPHWSMNQAFKFTQINGKQWSAMIENGTETCSGTTPDVGLTECIGLVLPQKKQMQRRPRTRWFRQKKKSESHLLCPKAPVPPQEEEDWEKEIQEVNPVDLAQVSYGLQPYGPEDVLSFDLQEMTLRDKLTTDLPITANYSPAKHHPCPVKWLCYKQPSEADQFADAEV